MRLLLRAAAAITICAGSPAAFIAPAPAQTCVCPSEGEAAPVSGPVIQAAEPPPPLPEYEQPPMPEPGHVWTPGYWGWNNVEYYWVPGVWVPPPRVGFLWTPPYWGFVAGVYMFHAGYWATQVGFYGGVNYGFGYTGAGYAGGRWQNGQFFYNTAVNNLGNVHVGNTYNAPVTVNRITNITNNVSYNGGPGGVQLKPTPEQEQVAAQPHVPATPAQMSQVRAASVTPQQFQSANLGKPPVAATPRPGAFNAPGVMPATAPGPALTAPPPAAQLPGLAAPQKPGQPAPGGKPLPAGQALPAEKPVAAQPPNTPVPQEKRPAGEQKLGVAPAQEKLQEKLPPATAPGAMKPSAAAKPLQPELAPKIERQQGLERPKPKEPQKAKELERPQGLLQGPQVPEKPQGLMRPTGGEKPLVPAMPGGPPRPAAAANVLPKPPPAAAERKSPQPGDKDRACGKPGLPPCPR